MTADTAPKLTTDPRLDGVLAELRKREPIFHHPEFGTSRRDFENMTDPDFWEVGASGQCYSRAFVLDTLVERHSTPHEDVWEASDFHCRELSAGLYLLTYRLVQAKERVTRRSTIWQRAGKDWKILYHQGTVVAATSQNEGTQSHA